MLQALYSRLRSAPGVTAAVLLLLAIAILFWRSEPRPSRHVARLANVQAKLDDGTCEFTADVELSDAWGRLAFGMRESAVRSTLAAVVRSKSRYMVGTSTAREALRHEMLAAVNGVIGSGRATAVRLPKFELL